MSRGYRQTTRIHVWLYQEDVDFLRTMYGGQDNVGFSKIIREMISKNVKNMQEAAARKSSLRHLKDLPDDILPDLPTKRDAADIT